MVYVTRRSRIRYEDIQDKEGVSNRIRCEDILEKVGVALVEDKMWQVRLRRFRHVKKRGMYAPVQRC